MAENLTIIQVTLSNKSTADLKTQGNKVLLHFFSFIDLNKNDVDAATNLKEGMCELVLDSSRETFQNVD